MTDRIENINPIGSVPPVKLRKIRRRGEDGQGQTHTWRELLEDEIKLTEEKEERKKKKKDRPEEAKEEKKPEPEDVEKESHKGHLDVIA